MRSGICPKCNSNEIYYSDAKGVQSAITTGSGSLLVRLYKDNKWVPDIWLLPLECYLCKECGYFESYVMNAEELSKLDESTNWRKLSAK
jgi:hypothetical protein